MNKRYLYLIGIVLETICLGLLVNPLIGFFMMFDQKSKLTYNQVFDDRIIMYGIVVILVAISGIAFITLNIIKFIKNEEFVYNKNMFIITSIWQGLLALLPIIFSILASMAFYNKDAIAYYSSFSQYCFVLTITCSIVLALFEFIKNLFILSNKENVVIKEIEKISLNIKMDKELFNELEAYSKEVNKTNNLVIEESIKAYIDNNKIK